MYSRRFIYAIIYSTLYNIRKIKLKVMIKNKLISCMIIFVSNRLNLQGKYWYKSTEWQLHISWNKFRQNLRMRIVRHQLNVFLFYYVWSTNPETALITMAIPKNVIFCSLVWSVFKKTRTTRVYLHICFIVRKYLEWITSIVLNNLKIATNMNKRSLFYESN